MLEKYDITNMDVALFSLFKLGGVRKKIHTEYIAWEAFQLAPERFSWRLPEFRGKGLMAYAGFLRFKYLKENGIVFAKGMVESKNLPAIRSHTKKDAKVYGKGFYIHIRILRWKYWKEKLFPQPVFLRDLTSTLKR